MGHWAATRASFPVSALLARPGPGGSGTLAHQECRSCDCPAIAVSPQRGFLMLGYQVFKK